MQRIGKRNNRHCRMPFREWEDAKKLACKISHKYLLLRHSENLLTNSSLVWNIQRCKNKNQHVLISCFIKNYNKNSIIAVKYVIKRGLSSIEDFFIAIMIWNLLLHNVLHDLCPFNIFLLHNNIFMLQFKSPSFVNLPLFIAVTCNSRLLVYF